MPQPGGGNVGELGRLDFGSNPGFGATAAQARYQSLLTLSCTPDISLNMSIDGGRHYQAGYRNLDNGGHLQPYQLFSDAGLSLAIPVDSPVAVPVGTGSDIQLPVYGRLVPRGDLPAGTYQDTLTVTLQW